MIVLLDAGPLELATNPRATSESLRCKQWLADLLSQTVRVVVPEITDYEVRRELIRAGRIRGLAHDAPTGSWERHPARQRPHQRRSERPGASKRSSARLPPTRSLGRVARRRSTLASRLYRQAS